MIHILLISSIINLLITDEKTVSNNLFLITSN